MDITITQTARPIKLAFLIKPGSRQSYLDCIEVCTALWGGMHFPIIPFYQKFSRNFMIKYSFIGEKPRGFYEGLFENFGVDFIVYDKFLDKKVLESFFDAESLVPLEEIKSSFAERISYGTGLVDILPQLIRERFKYIRNDSLSIQLPVYTGKDLYLKTILGSLSDEYLSLLKAVSPPIVKYPLVSRVDLQVLLTKDVLGYFEVGNFKLDGNEHWWAHETIYLGDPEDIDDLMQFWNLRAIGRDVLMLPIDDYDNPVYADEIKRMVKSNVGTRHNIYGFSVISLQLPEDFDFEKLSAYFDGFEPAVTNRKHGLFIYQYWIPRFWEKGYLRSYDRASAKDIYSKSSTINLSWKNLMSVPVISKFDVSKDINDRLLPAFCNELKIRFADWKGKYAQVLPDIPHAEAARFLGGFGREGSFIRDNRFVFFGSPFSDRIDITLPTNFQVFELLFKRIGHHIAYSTAGKLSELVFENIGGTAGVNFFRNKGVIPILEMFEKHQLVEYRDLFAAVMKYKKDIRWIQEPKQVVQQFLDFKIIQLGLKVNCPFCGRDSFYEVDKGFNILKCAVCQNEFGLPVNNPNELKWAYQVRGPFNMSNKANGILSVLLTLRFFQGLMRSGGISFLFSYEVFKEKKCVNEVDLTVLSQDYFSNGGKPDLLFCECKTGSDFEGKDLAKMKLLGELFPGAILTFATLKPVLGKKEKQRISALARYFRKGLGKRPICPILILTRNELIPDNPFDPTDHLKGEKGHRAFDQDDMGDLCDLTTNIYLGLKPFRQVYEDYWTAKADKHRQKKTDS